MKLLARLYAVFKEQNGIEPYYSLLDIRHRMPPMTNNQQPIDVTTQRGGRAWNRTRDLILIRDAL